MPYADPSKNKEYHAQKSKEWIENNPKKRAITAHRYWQSDKGKQVKRRSVLKTICWTPEGWDKAYEEQGGVCAICGHESTDGKNLHSDHDHERKIPRGLLCNECNLMLGKARDNPFLLENAAKYLRKYSDASQENS